MLWLQPRLRDRLSALSEVISAEIFLSKDLLGRWFASQVLGGTNVTWCQAFHYHTAPSHTCSRRVLWAVLWIPSSSNCNVLAKASRIMGRVQALNADLVTGPSTIQFRVGRFAEDRERVGARRKGRAVPSGRGEDQDTSPFLSTHRKARHSSLLMGERRWFLKLILFSSLYIVYRLEF